MKTELTKKDIRLIEVALRMRVEACEGDLTDDGWAKRWRTLWLKVKGWIDNEE